MNTVPSVDEAITALAACAEKLRGVVDALGDGFPKPQLVSLGGSGHRAYRHAESDRTGPLAAYCKAINICSLMGAIVALLRGGQVHEAYALCRVMDEQEMDILFLVLRSTQQHSYREQFLTEFYQEQLDDFDDPFSSTSRNRVPRQKIHAAVFSKETGFKDPSTAVTAMRSTTDTFSGFVHGAYGHIMDFYGSYPPYFHMGGFSGTPRMAETLNYVPIFFFRSAVAIAGLCRATGNTYHATRTDAVIAELEATFPDVGKA
jgi:hypothetical protein